VSDTNDLLTRRREGPLLSTRYLIRERRVTQTRQVTASIRRERPSHGATRGATDSNKLPHPRTTTKGDANASGDSKRECQTRSDLSARCTHSWQHLPSLSAAHGPKASRECGSEDSRERGAIKGVQLEGDRPEASSGCHPEASARESGAEA
jgi:hypothetical protein